MSSFDRGGSGGRRMLRLAPAAFGFAAALLGGAAPGRPAAGMSGAGSESPAAVTGYQEIPADAEASSQPLGTTSSPSTTLTPRGAPTPRPAWMSARVDIYGSAGQNITGVQTRYQPKLAPFAGHPRNIVYDMATWISRPVVPPALPGGGTGRWMIIAGAPGALGVTGRFTQVRPHFATSEWEVFGLRFRLVQQLERGGGEAGSLLTQEYEIVNHNQTTVVFDLVRYVDPNLAFRSTLTRNRASKVDVPEGRFIRGFEPEISVRRPMVYVQAGLQAEGARLRPNYRIEDRIANQRGFPFFSDVIFARGVSVINNTITRRGVNVDRNPRDDATDAGYDVIGCLAYRIRLQRLYTITIRATLQGNDVIG